MSILQRVNSGKVFIDDFDNSAVLGERWTVSPSLSSRYSLYDKLGYLRIKHADTPTYIVTNIPQEENLMFEMKNEYQPMVSTDIGGIIVFKSTDDRVELVEYYDDLLGATRSYLYVRMCKTGDVYDGYGSQDGIVWELIGSSRIEDATKIGFVLNGDQTPLSVPMDIDYAVMYTDRYLYVTNVQKDFNIKLYDSVNNLIQEVTVGDNETLARIDMFSVQLPFEGYIVLTSPTGKLIYQTPSMDINPGDEFQCTMNLEVKFQRKIVELERRPDGVMIPVTKFLDDAELKLDDMVHIGSMNDSNIEGMVVIKNLDPQDILGMEVFAESLSNSFSSHQVQFAPDLIGSPGDYATNLIVNIPADGTVQIWMRAIITDVITLSKKDLFKYKLCFRNI